MIMNTETFIQFFEHCIGSWTTERTYHYLINNEVERSRTEFMIKPLTNELKKKVAQDNQYLLKESLAELPGFSLGFHTISEKGEEVSQSLNLMFVPKEEQNGWLTGDYLRDRAYEESKPIISSFKFDNQHRELLMTTNYTQVVSVDSITLINPNLRIRKIINYQLPEAGLSLEIPRLVGFGVEIKVS